MSLFRANPAKKLASAQEALAAAEKAAADAREAFEANPDDKTATAKLVADQRAVNARRAITSAEQEVADVHRASLASELDALEKEIGQEAVERYREAEIAREVKARSDLQDKWIATEQLAREQYVRCIRAKEIAIELGRSTVELDGAQTAWRNAADHVCAEVRELLGRRADGLPGVTDVHFARRAVGWVMPTLHQ